MKISVLFAASLTLLHPNPHPWGFISLSFPFESQSPDATARFVSPYSRVTVSSSEPSRSSLTLNQCVRLAAVPLLNPEPTYRCGTNPYSRLLLQKGFVLRVTDALPPPDSRPSAPHRNVPSRYRPPLGRCVHHRRKAPMSLRSSTCSSCRSVPNYLSSPGSSPNGPLPNQTSRPRIRNRGMQNAYLLDGCLTNPYPRHDITSGELIAPAEAIMSSSA